MRLFVKLCGIRNEVDLEAAVEAGADAVGFVLTASPRQVSLPQAAGLRRLLPDHVLAVAVFHDPTPELLRQADEEVAPDLFQSETSTLVGVPPARMLPVVVGGDDLGRDIELALGISSGEMIVVDSAARGGTGRASDWDRLSGLATPAKMILAGGLNPENVGEAVSTVRPFGVDVSSGVERSPGEKDPERMRAFVAAARSATMAPEGGSVPAGFSPRRGGGRP
jgi:phosphoribosylanthranilate isomerase